MMKGLNKQFNLKNKITLISYCRLNAVAPKLKVATEQMLAASMNTEKKW